MAIVNGLALPNPLSNGTTADAVPVMADFNYLLAALNRALLDQGGTSGMNANSTQIHNLANGVASGDAVNLSQLGNYLPLAGGVLTGGLTGTTLSLSSTLGVTGATTLAALTASGLITANAGVSGTTLNLSGAAVAASYQFGSDGDLLYQNTTNVAALRIGTGAAQSTMFWAASASGVLASSPTNFLLGVNSTEVMRITSSGAVGIGITSPVATLDVNGGAEVRSTLNVLGASTLVALTASGLITGNAGFSGTTLSLSGAATLSGGGTSTTPAAGDNSTNIATTAFVATAGNAVSVQSVTSAATVTPTFLNDLVDITAQAGALTLANPSGTAKNGWGMVIRIADNGTPQTISYGTKYVGIGFTLPSTTVAGKVLLMGMIYNSGKARWEVTSTAEE